MAKSGEADQVQVRTVLDQLGDPEVIADEARQRFGITRARAGPLEGIAIALLLVGGLIIPVAGWFVGAVLLLVSRVWTVRDKLIGTFILPGGLLLPAFLGLFAVGVNSCDAVRQPNGVQLGACSSECCRLSTGLRQTL
ncbi:hypothetical protein BH20ACT22_BH20ACT22_18810 [soil metagenome]